MVIARFVIQDRLEKALFFEEIFLLVNTSIEIVLKGSFIIFSNADIWFAKKKLE